MLEGIVVDLKNDRFSSEKEEIGLAHKLLVSA